MRYRAEEDDLAHRLQRLVVRLHRELRDEAGDGAASGADARVLFDLRRHPGSGVSALSEMAKVTRSVMSERIKRLEAAGLVVRDEVERNDRRRIGLAVTAEGHALLERLARARRDRMAVRLARLSPSERRAIEAAVDALDRLPEWRSACELEIEQHRKTRGKQDERPKTRSA